MWSPPCVAYRAINEDAGALPPTFAPQPLDPSRALSSCCDRGFLSATVDRQVALTASGGKARRATILEISFDYSARGAALQWVSQYPHECEVRIPGLSILPIDLLTALIVGAGPPRVPIGCLGEADLWCFLLSHSASFYLALRCSRTMSDSGAIIAVSWSQVQHQHQCGCPPRPLPLSTPILQVLCTRWRRALVRG